MRTLRSLALALLIATPMFTSCGGGGIKGDAAKMADILCKMAPLQKKMKESMNDPEAMKKIQEEMKGIGEEMEKLQKDFESKYENNEANKKAVAEVMKDKLKGCLDAADYEQMIKRFGN